MRLDHDSDELTPGRLFTHGQLSDPMTGGPLYCRIRSFDGTEVEYEAVYRREDGSERIGSPWRLPIGHFIEGTERFAVRRSGRRGGFLLIEDQNRILEQIEQAILSSNRRWRCFSRTPGRRALQASNLRLSGPCPRPQLG